MTTRLSTIALRMTAAFTVGALINMPVSQQAAANDFANITGNITDSTATLPNLLATVAYIGGAGLVRLGAGGGLLSYPMVMEAMANTIGTGGTTPTEVISGTINTLSF